MSAAGLGRDGLLPAENTKRTLGRTCVRAWTRRRFGPIYQNRERTTGGMEGWVSDGEGSPPKQGAIGGIRDPVFGRVLAFGFGRPKIEARERGILVGRRKCLCSMRRAVRESARQVFEGARTCPKQVERTRCGASGFQRRTCFQDRWTLRAKRITADRLKEVGGLWRRATLSVPSRT